MRNFKRTAALFVLAFMVFCLPLVAKDKKTVSEDECILLAAIGSLEDIKDAYEYNAKVFNTYVYGAEQETFLMLVLKNNRDWRIIKFCVTVDTKVRSRVTTKGRTALMYAARYCTDETVISMILKNSSLFAQNRRAHVLQQDKKGYDSFAYSRNNPNYKVYMELYKYAPDLGITMAPEDDPSYSSDLGEQSLTRTTTPPPSSPSQMSTPPPPTSTTELSTPPPDKNGYTSEESPSVQGYQH